MIKELKIDEQLRDLFPPLTEDEFNQLEQNIIRDGCASPLFTWNNYIVDGHNRYNICKKHNIEFQIIELAYDTKEDVISWMVDTQLGRRNLTPIQKIAITEKYRPIYEKQAKERMLLGKSDPMLKSAQGSTRDALAKKANIGHDTYNKGKKIIDFVKENEGKLTEEQKEIIKKTEIGEIKINTAYNELLGKKEKDDKNNNKIQSNESKTKACIKCGEIKSLENFYIGHEKCKECEIEELEHSKEVRFIQKGEAFKDITGNYLPISEESKMDKHEFNELILDTKTPKNYEDYINPNSEIEWTTEVCEDLIWQLDSKYFTLNNVIDKMETSYIYSVINVLDEHIKQINNIKNKLKERIGD